MKDLGGKKPPLIGKAEAALDDKRRWSLPPKFRYAFPTEESRSVGHFYPAVVLPWFRGGVAVLPEPAWAEIEAGLDLLDFTEDDADGCLLMCLSRAEHLATDPEGRLMFTPEHCEWMRLAPGQKARLVAVGRGKMVEVFNADEWSVVQSTGSNPAAHGNDVAAYETALRQLLQRVREAKETAARNGTTPERVRGDGDDSGAGGPGGGEAGRTAS